MRVGASSLLLCSALLVGGALAHEQPTGPPLVLAPGYHALNYAAPLPGSYQLPPIQPAADAPYLDSKGHQARLHALYTGRVTILSFIYTHCDDVNGCPLASFVMAQIAKRLHADLVKVLNHRDNQHEAVFSCVYRVTGWWFSTRAQ